MRPPQITTVIPTYRRAKTLKRAIESALNQSYPHVQVAVFDDASNDGTQELVYEMMRKDPRISYFCHPENIGSNANFDYGLRQVKTPYFSFLSDDDYLLPCFYETTLEGFKRFPEIGFCAGGCVYVNEEGEVRGYNPRFPDGERYFSNPQGVLEILDGAVPLWTSILFKTAILSKVGYLNVDKLAMDIDFYARATLYFPYFVKKEACTVFVRHSGSISSQKNLEIFYPGIYQVILELKNSPAVPADCLASFEKLLLRRLKILILKLVRSYLEEGNFPLALQAAQIFMLNLHEKKMGFLLTACIKMCHKNSLFHRFFKLVSQAYRWLRRGKAKIIQV